MAAVPDSRSGAGGKMVTNRRRQRLTATPYDRPLLRAPPKSPNWFTGVIIPSARALASGAGKFISSAIFSDSESSSSEDVDSASEDDGGNDNEYESPCGGGNALNEEKPTSSEMRREPQLGMQRSETKWLIEKLIMHENFSREECDRLTTVLNSRVKDWSVEAGDKRSFVCSPRQAADHEDILNKAVLEAKKWFQEKNRGSSSGAELARGTCNPNSAMIDHMESEVGSPVDMARSYMRERPSWASPMEHVELSTPLTTTMKLFKERTPYSVAEDVLSSSKRRNSLASGSWNIQEELRKVRSKAVEDMLRTPAKNDSSLYAVAATQEDLSGTGKLASSAGEEIFKPHSFWRTKPMDALMDVGVNADPALVALESGQDGKSSEAPSSHPDASASGINEKYQETIPSDGIRAPSDLSYPTSPGHTEQLHSADQHATEISGPPETAAAELGARVFTNGSSPAEARCDEENHEDTTATASIEIRSTNGTNVDGNCELLTEAFMEVPFVTETNSSTSRILEQNEESLVESTKPDLTTVKQQGKRVVRNTKRGRGRGK